MRTKILLPIFLLSALFTFSQESKLNVIEDAIKKKNYRIAVSYINAEEDYLQGMDSEGKAKFYFLKAKAYMGTKQFQIALAAFETLEQVEQQSGQNRYTYADQIKNQMVQEVYKMATKQYQSKDYASAAKNFYSTYKMSPMDTIFMYNAAVSSTLIKDYESALKYYRNLQELGFTGIQTMYFATNKETGVKENLGSKGNRDIMVKSGSYTNPVDESSKSKMNDIVKNIAYILKEQGKINEALMAIQEARNLNPKDLNLVLTEADIYYQLGNIKKFEELMQDAINLDPSNPQLFFNLGVISYDRGEKDRAIAYYERAIMLKPDYADAYMNLAVLILDEEKAVVEEMNKNLSNFKVYDKLALKQKSIYKNALPYLEKADEFGRNVNIVRTLYNIYSTLDMKDKATLYKKIYNKLKR